MFMVTAEPSDSLAASCAACSPRCGRSWARRPVTVCFDRRWSPALFADITAPVRPAHLRKARPRPARRPFTTVTAPMTGPPTSTTSPSDRGTGISEAAQGPDVTLRQVTRPVPGGPAAPGRSTC